MAGMFVEKKPCFVYDPESNSLRLIKKSQQEFDRELDELRKESGELWSEVIPLAQLHKAIEAAVLRKAKMYILPKYISQEVKLIGGGEIPT